ncbi:hypothetical protein DYD21_12095 [Rhodohalobacter sp. SW132]|uniref:hypothetical protein n=1 Tax=Rhodohalobacter sp. SW132 TaxID=2293433 RepID=UPI000E23EA61|nr:hypothetical protein [Rhodohalobacter sp. SW132]REL33503.1 hypothetical protein DYD21_12095 [Rhodohalobacter sp. SW132]
MFYHRYFGDQNALGQTPEWNNGNVLIVTAVVEQWSDQSRIKFSMIELPSIHHGGGLSSIPKQDGRRV